jgi:hypothetical protein
MNQEKTYQFLAIAFGIIALIFIVMFFTRDSDPVADRLSEIASNIEECQERIADWRSENATATTTATSTDISEELEDILSDCGETLREGSEYLGQ